MLIPFFLLLTSAQGQPQYQKRLKVYNPSNDTLVNFTVPLATATDSLVLNGKLQANAYDIWFVQANCEQLYYWIEEGSFNTDSTVFWIMIPYLLPQDSFILYWVYGDPLVNAANSYHDGKRIFQAFDDFNHPMIDTNMWNLVYGNSSSVYSITADGYFTYSVPTLANNMSGLAHHLPAPTGTSYEIRTRMKIEISNLSDSDAMFGWMFPTYTGNRYTARDKVWVTDDEVPIEYIVRATNINTPSFNSGVMRGVWNSISLRAINGTLSSRRTVPKTLDYYSPSLSYSNTSNFQVLFIGSVAYGGIPTYYDWVFMREANALEPLVIEGNESSYNLFCLPLYVNGSNEGGKSESMSSHINISYEKGKLEVAAQAGKKDHIHIQIIELNGQIAYEISKPLQADLSRRIVMSLPHLSSGIYIVSAHTSDSYTWKKVFIP